MYWLFSDRYCSCFQAEKREWEERCVKVAEEHHKMEVLRKKGGEGEKGERGEGGKEEKKGGKGGEKKGS